MSRLRKLKDYYPYTKAVAPLFVKSVDFDCDPPLNDIYSQHHKVVHVLNHSVLISPLVTYAIGKTLIEHGASDRTHIAVAHKIFYQFPIARQWVKWITQLDHPVRFNEFIWEYQNRDFNDFFLMPEGDLCNFYNGEDIAPFRSVKFIEAGLKVGAPFLLLVFKGAEKWARPVKLNKRMTRMMKFLPNQIYDYLQEKQTVSVPLPPTRIKELKLRGKLYQPSLSYKDLSQIEARRAEQLQAEADSMRTLMQAMLKDM